ncbi:BatA domain-containing protein [Aquimonas voraii]|uniref:N-terminal double-transmembrane domain-containing protein n=1 Tax=Aquimonas voraii TaxID=265719 RepID=A0A1G6VCN0_9GAMM|nr:BatA domain-containing protein [Aquimonas voraii]SDD51409.1 N-terminal double-transmembrane domain-containing protein [Aquimonas voraii]
MSLLLPTALFALLALALPLLIHLQRRRETPPPRLFAALAYIDPQARPKQRVRLRDRLLLLLRLLLLAVLAFVLAQPLLHGRAGPPWVLLWPGLDPAQVGALNEDAELRWLAPGFPRVDAVAAPAAGPTFSLLRELAFERPAAQALEVRVPRELGDWDGAPLQLGRAIEWTVLPVELPVAPQSPQVLRVAVHVMEHIESEQRRALSALRAYFEAMGENAPLRFVEASEAPPAEGVDALWVMAPMQTPTPRAADALLQPSANDAKVQDDARGDGGALRAPSVAPEGAGHPLADTSAERGESAATVGQGPPYAGALASLSPTWRAWLRDGGRALISGSDTRETQPPQIEPASAETEVLAALDARAHTLWRGEHASLSRVLTDGAELRLLDCPLDPRCLPELLAPRFPRLLQGWLEPERAPVSHIDANLVAPSADGTPPQPAGTPLRDALILALLLLLLAERWLAATRRPA